MLVMTAGSAAVNGGASMEGEHTQTIAVIYHIQTKYFQLIVFRDKNILSLLIICQDVITN